MVDTTTNSLKANTTASQTDRDLQISHSSPDLSLLPVVYQQIRRPKKQDWCDKRLSKPRKLDWKSRTRNQSCTRSQISRSLSFYDGHHQVGWFRPKFICFFVIISLTWPYWELIVFPAELDQTEFVSSKPPKKRNQSLIFYLAEMVSSMLVYCSLGERRFAVPSEARSVRHDLGPPTQSISRKYLRCYDGNIEKTYMGKKITRLGCWFLFTRVIQYYNEQNISTYDSQKSKTWA